MGSSRRRGGGRGRLPRLRWDAPRGRSVRFWQGLTPPQLFVGSFALLIIAGTLGLRYLPGLYRDQSLGWLDCLFTSTSAVCVTGLIVVDTSTYFTLAGQAYLLLLIQLGGLGMLAFTSLIIVALGRRLSLRSETLSAGGSELVPKVNSKRLTLDVVRFTLVLEALGAMLLYLIWAPRLGWFEAAWPALFHSVSAFCNAGFSTFSDSLVGYHASPATMTVVMLLITIGGLGFLTLEESYLRLFKPRSALAGRMSLHSRLVLWTSGTLLIAGALMFTWFEWQRTLGEMSLGNRLVNGAFMSVTARTAGFNTIDYASATDSSNFLTILLMMIGGSPGSTAGGLKTTTFALIGLRAWSRLQARPTASFAGRSIADETIQRAVGLLAVAVAVVAVGLFTLARSETMEGYSERFLVRMFEVVSAFNTVGLSMGLTADLSATGRICVTLLMFLGRVGPLTLASALVLRRSRSGQFRYAYEEVVIG